MGRHLSTLLFCLAIAYGAAELPGEDRADVARSVRAGRRNSGIAKTEPERKRGLTRTADHTALTVTRPVVSAVLVFRNVRLFDGTRVIPKTNVVVVGGRIASVGQSAVIPTGAKIIDGAGKTLLPGLIDSHTHAFFPAQLKQAAVFGVTTEMDMAGLPQFARSLRREQKAGQDENRADMFSAGHPLTVKGGHPTQIPAYRNIPVIKSLAHVPMFVDDRVAEGSDFIKIVYDDAAVYGFRPEPTLSREMVAAAVKRAHFHKKLAVAHVGASEFARQAIAEGIDGLVHMFVDELTDESLLKLAVQKQVFVVPTLTVMEYEGGTDGGASLTADSKLAPYLSSDSVARLNASRLGRTNSKLSLDVLKRTVCRFYEAGVPILAGSDAPNPGTAHGASIHRELELLVEAGLTPIDALRAATSLPAEKFRMADRGRIVAGLRADLLLVNGDPTRDISTTRRIAGVWKAGRQIDREQYRLSLHRRDRVRGQSATDVMGVVSQFDGSSITSQFGAGWEISTDRYEGGRSTAKMALTQPGANGSAGALQITGKVDGRIEPRWAGAIFFPGKQEMAAADLSSQKSISFWAKGDNKTYSVVLFTKRGGFNPASELFVSGTRWKRHRFSLKDLGTDGRDITAVFIGNCDQAGRFALEIDDVRFE